MSEDLIKQFFTSPTGETQKDGFFLEMGAVDGIEGSNSLPFEERLGWNGVLIEANPRSCAKLFKEPRRQRAIKLCSSCCDDSIGFLNFEVTNDPNVGAAMEVMSDEWRTNWHLERDGLPQQTEITRVPCSPLGRLLRTSGVVRIDMFSLDVEAAELMVLGGFDWSIPVRVFIIEVEARNSDALAEMMTQHGYVLSDFEVGRKWGVHGADQLWVHPNWADVDGWHGGAEWKQYAPEPPELRTNQEWKFLSAFAFLSFALAALYLLKRRASLARLLTTSW
jgi:FkbM family methyltransferase